MERCTPKVPINAHLGIQHPIQHRMGYEQQRITYEKNYAFYDGFIGEWFNRKKILN